MDWLWGFGFGMWIAIGVFGFGVGFWCGIQAKTTLKKTHILLFFVVFLNILVWYDLKKQTKQSLQHKAPFMLTKWPMSKPGKLGQHLLHAQGQSVSYHQRFGTCLH